MKAVPPSRLRKHLDRFARWFLNVSPTAQVEAVPPRAAAAGVKSRAKPRRQQHRDATVKRAIRKS
jgi:hypothetical protein